MPDSVRDAALRWERRENSCLFVLSGQVPLARELVDAVSQERGTLKNAAIVDVIVDCGGGDISAAYQLVSLFRDTDRKLRVFVPDWAKSAATFFCLGADEIYLSRTAELGPLDAQIPDPRNPDAPISALEQFQAVEYLRTSAFETLDLAVRMLITRTDMRVRHVLVEARKFAADLVAPLYGQIDPLHFGSAHRALRVSMEYGQRLMSRYAYADWSEKRINTLLEKLTWKYPAHDFVIDYAEARELGLLVVEMEGEREADAHAIVDGLDNCVGFLAQDAAITDDLTHDIGKGGSPDAAEEVPPTKQ